MGTTDMREQLKTWFYTTRPHTLSASLAPMLVVLGALIAEGTFRLIPYLLCVTVAFFAQISSNLANDYFDFIGGKDTDERVGFERVLTTGRVSQKEIMILLGVALAITSIAGFALAATEGWELLIIGVFVLIGALAYSSGPFPLSHNALGDFAVVLLFGLIPMLASYYAIAGRPPLYLLFFALTIGVWEVNILVCNNYRDYKEDKKSGKKTIVVRMGGASGPILYLINSLITLGCLVIGLLLLGKWIWAIVLFLLAGSAYMVGTLAIRKAKGKQLNKLLVYTSKLTLYTGIALFLALIL
ncbi:MAG: 1,4-dihydroxy-2-naphthoate octaprenyltransferase [Porphyromonas sp.]|nr:1,4-dihydroxy-2-naphthoate octaprenyltransferase [Porphyromonas sp.]